MSDNEITQPIPALSATYRYVVRKLGHRNITAINLRSVDEYGAECVDSWTGDVMTVHWAGSQELASLVAETQCAERNAPEAALTFASKLALYIDRAREIAAEDDHSEGDVLEDVEHVLEWHLGRLRGITQEPLDQNVFRIPATEFAE